MFCSADVYGRGGGLARRDHARVGRALKDLRCHVGGATTVEVDVVVDRLDHALSPDLPGRRGFIDNVAALGASLGPLRVPRTQIHGDLAPSNCLVSRSGVRFVDWEGAVPEAEPLSEIVLFLNHYARATPKDNLRRPEPTGAFRRAFTEDTWLAEVTQSTWLSQLADLGLPGEAADYLLVATLTDLATGHASTAHARGAGSRRNWSELLTIFARERRVA